MSDADTSFTITDVLGVIKRNVIIAAVITIIATVCAYTLTYYVPKQYKATAELAIQASYFHNPMVNDIINQVHNPSELNAQKATLFRQALNDEFLDYLGEQHGIYASAAGSDDRVLEREELLKRLEYYSLSATTYYLAVRANDPKGAYGLLNDVVDRVKGTLINERRETLVKTRDAIQKSVESIGLALQDVSDPFSAQRRELAKLQVEIQTLTSKYTNKHPEVVALRRKAEVLNRTLRRAPGVAPKGNEGAATDVYANSEKTTTRDIHHELLKKLSYLNIVLEMEKDDASVSYLGLVKEPAIPVKPYFPKKRVFAAIGMVVGLLLSLIFVIFRELRRGTFLSPMHASDALGVDFLGILPTLVGSKREEIRLLESPRRMLPYTVAEEGSVE